MGAAAGRGGEEYAMPGHMRDMWLRDSGNTSRDRREASSKLLPMCALLSLKEK
jgi:hypothetical protein